MVANEVGVNMGSPSREECCAVDGNEFTREGSNNITLRYQSRVGCES